MDKCENIKFIDDDSPVHCSYVWKKKKALQKEKNQNNEVKDFRQICIDNTKFSDCSFEESNFECKTYFGKEGSSSGDDVPELAEEEDEFNADVCLSPRAPLVIAELEEEEFVWEKSDLCDGENEKQDFRINEERAKENHLEEVITEVGLSDLEQKYVRDVPCLNEECAEEENPHLGLEVVVNESDHERIALTSSLTVKDGDGDTLKQGELKVETVTDHRQAVERSEKAVEEQSSRRRVHFEDELAEKGECNKKEHVLPLSEEGYRIDVVFTEDVTVRVSFKDGSVLVEERESGAEGKPGSGGDSGAEDNSICKRHIEERGSDTKNTASSEKNENVLEQPLYKGEENTILQNQYKDAYFTPNTDRGGAGLSAGDALTEKSSCEAKSGSEEWEITKSNLKHEGDVCEKKDAFSNGKSAPEAENKNKHDKKQPLSLKIAESLESSRDLKFVFSVKENEKLTENANNITQGKLKEELADSKKKSKTDELLPADKLCNLDSSYKCEPLDRKTQVEIENTKEAVENNIENQFEHLLHYNDDRSSMFILHDIMEEESVSDQSEDENSSDSGGFFEAEEHLDTKNNIISNDEALKNYSKFDPSEDSSNSEGSLEKCEIEPSEKEIKKKYNPVLTLLEMHEKEEIYESSLEALQDFRSGLIPGITSASNWISSCDSGEELSLGVGVVESEDEEEEWEVGGEGEGACGRRWTGVSTGSSGGADQLSSEPSAPSDSETDSDSLQGASLDTVIQVTTSTSTSASASEQCQSTRPVAVAVIDTSDKDAVASESPKVVLANLLPIKRSTNALENLPLIFPHARKLVVTKPVNKFENLFKPTEEKCASDSVDNAAKECAGETEKHDPEEKESQNVGERRADVKIERLFQFNVNQDEGVTSFSENAGENEMKQKKKQEDNRAQEDAVAASSELCNGYHRPLKSALKRSSTKKSKKKNRVQFDESLNKFFDADYVILIREEPDDFDGDYDVGGCDCGEDFCYDDCCDEDDEEDGFQEPPSPRFDLCAAFEPPVEFVDQVTLSPPDGYKDMGHYCPHHHPRPPPPLRRPDGREEWQNEGRVEDVQVADTRTEATNTEDDLNQESTEKHHRQEQSLVQQQQLQKQQTLQQQQQQRYIVETITMTTVTERRIVREADDQRLEGDGKLGGILKGGKLWKSTDSSNLADNDDYTRKQETVATEEDDRRGVRFSEGDAKNEVRDVVANDSDKNQDCPEGSASFKVGNVISSSKPNSAVRQLFPSQRFMSPPPAMVRSPDAEDDQSKYAMTTENLRAFEESKKSKLHEFYSSRGNSKDGSCQTASSPQREHPPSDDDEGLSSSLIKRTIERNTLRRSLLKYPHDIRLKRNQNKLKNENSLVERIKQLTCDVDDDIDGKGKEGENTRTSPPGEESERIPGTNQNRPDKIASSGMSSTYKKFTDLFSRRDKLEAVHPSVILQTPVSVERQYAYYQPVYHQQTTPPDLGNGLNTPPGLNPKHAVQRNSVTTEARKQFLSSLAPLTACVSGNLDDSPGYRDNAPIPGIRTSVASTSTAQDSEYSLDDIEEALNSDENKSQPQPDVVAGTPAGNGDQDELALFVQQDAGRIERIRKRYSSTPNSAGSDDDEHDDYGFNRRPSVRGIKPRFGSTTEILQQMQSQLQPPPLACPSRTGSHITWPYYTPDDPRRVNPTRPALPIMKEETHFTYLPDPNLEYATNSPVDPSRTYQHQMIYSSSGNLHQPLRIGGGGDLQYPTRVHHLHSDSPPRVPPMGMIMPFQEHDFPYRTTAPIYARRAIPGSVVQMRVSPIPAGSAVRLPLHPPYVEPEPHYSTQPLPPGTTSIIRVGQQQTIRVPYPAGGPVQVHLLATRRSESPQRGSPTQYVVARGTQTSSISSTYYSVPPRVPFYPSRGPLVYSDPSPQNNNYPPNPHRAPSPIQSLTSSPTRMKPQNERGVPEGAASSSPAFPQDSVYQMQVSSGTNIPSPGSEAPLTCDTATSPQTPIYYSMNV